MGLTRKLLLVHLVDLIHFYNNDVIKTKQYDIPTRTRAQTFI